MGRQLTLPLFVATLVTTWYGGIFGVTQIAFEHGIYNLFTQGFFWYITYIIFAFVMVKKIRSYGALTLPDMVKNIYGTKSAKLAAVLIFFKSLPVTYVISLGLFLQVFLPLTLMQASGLGVAAIVLYSVSGGLRAIVFTDLALFFIMCIGVASVLLFSILNFGGLKFLHNSLPSSYFHPCSTKSMASTLVWILLAFSTTFISPAFYQRCLAAASDKIARKGILIATFIWFLFDICTTFGAMYARAVLPEADSLNAYLTYSLQLLPNGFRGLFLASIAAAIIASLDAFLFIASTVLFYDLPVLKIKNIKHKHLAAIIITASITLLISIYFDGRIEQAWLLLKSYFSVCLLLPILVGYLLPSLANDRLFIINSLASCLSITIWHNFYIGCATSLSIFVGYYLTRETRITTLMERILRKI